jgi:ABC-type transporter Mla maintaining outer membrane lipid asymmetry ATPase subunit MlaF
MPTLLIRNSESGASCEIEPGHGFVYVIEAATPGGLDALLDDLMEVPGTQVAHGVGGMVSNINVLENIALPALYFGLARSREFDVRVIEAFGACGVDSAQAEALCRRHPGELCPYEKRLAGFVRSLLMRPDILVYNRFLEGLTGAEMERAIALDAVYRDYNPMGTSAYLMLGDLPARQVQCHRRHVT